MMTNYTKQANAKLVETCIQPKLSFNFEQLNAHQINPAKPNQDEIFENGYMDVTIIILTKASTGNVKYFLADSPENYKRQGPYGGQVNITSNKTIHKLYSLPADKKYAYGAMHDVNGNGYLDRNFMKMPKEPFAFSGRKRFFFMPPKFKKANFDLREEIVISIK